MGSQAQCSLSAMGHTFPPEGLAALVIKPSLLGSFEAVERIHAWAHGDASHPQVSNIV
jgi:O-succinylbenzoate synthase